MQKTRKIIIFLALIITLSFSNIVRAEDEIEEEFDFTGMSEFLQGVASEANETPTINSRHAVVYDRATRKYIIREKRK